MRNASALGMVLTILTAVSTVQLILQLASPAHSSLMEERSCELRIIVQSDWQEAHSTEPEIILRQFGLSATRSCS